MDEIIKEIRKASFNFVGQHPAMNLNQEVVRLADVEEILSNRLTKLVSLQNADWQVIKKVGNPKETDRYLIAYRVNGMTHIKFFTADYDTHYGWSNILDDIEIMAYKKIEFDESILSN